VFRQNLAIPQLVSFRDSLVFSMIDHFKGLEYGQECWCGDVENLTGNGGVIGADSECTMACSGMLLIYLSLSYTYLKPGDATHICGGPSRLTFYSWSGLNTWNRPANTGRYEFLIGGLIVPLVATLGLNNKVSFP
jgi:hypothetical protein